MTDDRRALAARKKIRRAQQLTREAGRELAQAFDCDVIAATRVTDPAGVARAAAMIGLALDRAVGPVDVTVTAPIGATKPNPPEPLGAQEARHDTHAQRR